MAENGGGSAPARPTISLPPRAPAMDGMFAGGASPGPMTLVSNFFNDPDSDCRSFSQLLAGAMASPAMNSQQRPHNQQNQPPENYGSGGGGDFRFQQNRPAGLTVSQQTVFTVPPGLSPASLLDSPAAAFFSSAQGSFGFSNQQHHAQTTQAPSIMHVSAQQYSSLSSAPPRSSSQIQPRSSGPAPHQMREMRPHKAEPSVEKESSEISYPEQQRSQLPLTVDKPADDGYNWRKYGQKQVKGSEYPRSYYKCTGANCPVKKKVERSLEGQVTEIIYKGQHNHQPPQGNNKRGKDAENAMNSESGGYNSHSLAMKDQEFSQATQEQACGSSESDEVGNPGNGADGKDEDEPESKRRHTEVIRPSEMPSNHRTVTEPRIIVQTTSEVDLLDDGYRWRKYGQKVVKGNPYPRSYYKCTTQGCNVRKHVERAASDPKAVITTYEGKHTHDVPAAKNSSHATANMVSQLRAQQNSAQENQASGQMAEFRNNGRQGIASLRFKEEQMT